MLLWTINLEIEIVIDGRWLVEQSALIFFILWRVSKQEIKGTVTEQKLLHPTWDDYSNDSNESMLFLDGLFITRLVAGWWFGAMEFYDFPYIGNNHPNWLSYFSEGLKPPTRSILFLDGLFITGLVGV